MPDTTDTDPVATDDTGINTFGTNPHTVDILANDNDPNGQALTITQINGVNVVAGQTVVLTTGQEVTLNANGTITLVNTGGATGSTSFSYTISDTDGNTDSAFVTFDAQPICFCAGTLIETPYGPRPIEQLSKGDLVLTRDGPQPVSWAGARELQSDAHTAPIEFKPSALGNKKALLVSPQHRMLITGFQSELYFGSDEVLVPAKFLVNDETVVQRPISMVTYCHVLFENHEVIIANGVPSESYYPGAYSLPGLDLKAREELFSIFPELRLNPVAYGQSARVSVKGHAAHLLVA